jgi:hypothetical protein
LAIAGTLKAAAARAIEAAAVRKMRMKISPVECFCEHKEALESSARKRDLIALPARQA